MSRKNIIDSYVMLDAVDASLSHDTFSNPTNVKHLDNCGIQVSWDSTVDGTLQVFASNEKDAPQDWTELDFGSSIVLNNLESSHLISMNQLPFSWLAVSFTPQLGSSGAVTVRLTSKLI